MRTLRVYSLNNFQLYHTAVLTLLIMLYITSLVFIYLITGSLYLLTTFLQVPPPPTPPQNIFIISVRSFSVKSASI